MYKGIVQLLYYIYLIVCYFSNNACKTHCLCIAVPFDYYIFQMLDFHLTGNYINSNILCYTFTFLFYHSFWSLAPLNVGVCLYNLAN